MKSFLILTALIATMASNVSASSCLHLVASSRTGRTLVLKRVLRHNPSTLFNSAPLGYSQITVDTKSAVAYIAGQTAKKQDGSIEENSDVKEQLKSAEENLKLAMASVGVTTELQSTNVMSLTMYIVGYKAEHLATVTEVGSTFGKPSNTLIGIEALALPTLKVEIEATVALPKTFIEKLKTATCDGNMITETKDETKVENKVARKLPTKVAEM